MRMRSIGVLGATGAVVAVLAGLAGCGTARVPVARVPPVRLSVTAPGDRLTTLADQVYVSGSVSPPGAAVLVAGRPASVSSGTFGVHVPIGPGANVIDVLAGAPHAAGAMTAVRVYRQLPVTVPDLGDRSPDAAVAALTRLRLSARVEDVGGFLQSLIPTDRHVCSTSPGAGRVLAPASQVQVQVAKIC